MAAKRSEKQIIIAASSGEKTLEQLCDAGIVVGEYGITALAARSIVNELIKQNKLSVIYDACNCPSFSAK